MVFRLSQKLAKKLKAGPLSSEPLDENPYADWSAHLFTASRTQYIIVANTQSLYSVVMYGKGTTKTSQFSERALGSIRDFMNDDGLAFIYQRFVAPASGSIRFGKALNRSVIGSMNELIRLTKLWLEQSEISPHDLGFTLNDILLSALARSKSDFYWKPREAFTSLVDRMK